MASSLLTAMPIGVNLKIPNGVVVNCIIVVIRSADGLMESERMENFRIFIVQCQNE